MRSKSDTFGKLIFVTMRKKWKAYTWSFFLTSCFIVVEQLLLFSSKILLDQLENKPPTMFVDIAITNLLGGYTYLHSHLWLLPIITLGVAIMYASIILFRMRSIHRLMANLGYDNQTSLLGDLEHAGYPALKRLSNGDALQTVTRDERQTRQFLAMEIISTIYLTLFQVISSFVLLYFVNPTIAFVSIIILPMIFIYSLIGTPQVRKRFQILDESEARMTERIEENIKAVRLVKAYGNESYEIKEFDKCLVDYKKKSMRLLAYNNLFFCGSDVIVAIQTMLVLLTSIVLIVDGKMTVGTLTLATSFSAGLVFPVKRLGRAFANYGQASVSYNRMKKVINLPKEDYSSTLKPDLKGDIVFENVSLRYEDGEKDVLQDINLTIKEGTTTAVMGRTGSGKTALINLLSRLYEPTEGRVLINGYDIKEVNLKYLRDNVGVVLQEPFLFSRSIKSNIGIKTKDIPVDRLNAAASIAALEESTEVFPQGYDTFVGEKGISLSGGQKQRISIARTLFQETPILVLDDSLSAVDTSTDLRIRRALQDRKKGTTTIIITHRVATAKDADQIVILDDGKIVARGDDMSLLQQDGLYRRINVIQGRIKEGS